MMICKICEEKTCKYRYENGLTKWHRDYKYCPYCGHNLSKKVIQ